MVYEDMMYGTDGIMPGAAATADQEAELRYQIRRQAHHPAIVGWSGCVECILGLELFPSISSFPWR